MPHLQALARGLRRVAASKPAKKASRTTKKRAPPKKAAKKAVKRAAPKKAAAKKRAAKKPAFGRPGTAGKAEGDAAVQAWLAAQRADQRPTLERLDALITATIPGVKKALKWSMPMYGLPGKGWIAHIAAFKEHVALGFFAGAQLEPPLPEGEGKGMRRVKLRAPADYDEARLRGWIEQAARIPGWGKA